MFGCCDVTHCGIISGTPSRISFFRSHSIENRSNCIASSLRIENHCAIYRSQVPKQFGSENLWPYGGCLVSQSLRLLLRSLRNKKHCSLFFMLGLVNQANDQSNMFVCHSPEYT